tara:strand:+ start:2578 stop:3747 length:1170 start_codon:yes stop_codon:yes gene_type:complete
MSSFKNLKKKRLCILSSSRADFGILRKLIKKLTKKKNVKLDLILTGSHNSKKFGNTQNEAQENKIFNFDSLKIPNKNLHASHLSINSSILLRKLSKKFKNKKYSFLIVLGDRYEIFIGSFAASLYKIPIAHLSGGDETQGAYDNQFRHGITKLAHLHFPTNEISKKRILKMGENPKYVYNYGSLSLENIKSLKRLDLKNIEKEFNFKFQKKYFLVCYHPETLNSKNKKNFQSLIKAILKFKKIQFIFTSSNSDEGGDEINTLTKKISNKNKNIVFVKSFGQEKYLNVLKFSCGIIGNSSSGVHEAPSFKIGSLNLGKRQHGRIKIKSIINCNFETKNIINGINKILSKQFRNRIKSTKSPYYKKNTSENIIKKIFSLKGQDLLIKKFYG